MDTERYRSSKRPFKLVKVHLMEQMPPAEKGVSVYIKMLKSALLFKHLCVSVTDEEHSNERKRYENGTERKEHIAHTDKIVKNSRKYGGDYLSRH